MQLGATWPLGEGPCSKLQTHKSSFQAWKCVSFGCSLLAMLLLLAKWWEVSTDLELLLGIERLLRAQAAAAASLGGSTSTMSLELSPEVNQMAPQEGSNLANDTLGLRPSLSWPPVPLDELLASLNETGATNLGLESLESNSSMLLSHMQISLSRELSSSQLLEREVEAFVLEFRSARSTLALSTLLLAVYIISWILMTLAINDTRISNDISLRNILLLSVFGAIDIAASVGFIMVRIIMYSVKNHSFARQVLESSGLRDSSVRLSADQLTAFTALRLVGMRSSSAYVDAYVGSLVLLLTILRLYAITRALGYYRRLRRWNEREQLRQTAAATISPALLANLPPGELQAKQVSSPHVWPQFSSHPAASPGSQAQQQQQDQSLNLLASPGMSPGVHQQQLNVPYQPLKLSYLNARQRPRLIEQPANLQRSPARSTNDRQLQAGEFVLVPSARATSRGLRQSGSGQTQVSGAGKQSALFLVEDRARNHNQRTSLADECDSEPIERLRDRQQRRRNQRALLAAGTLPAGISLRSIGLNESERDNREAAEEQKQQQLVHIVDSDGNQATGHLLQVAAGAPQAPGKPERMSRRTSGQLDRLLAGQTRATSNLKQATRSVVDKMGDQLELLRRQEETLRRLSRRDQRRLLGEPTDSSFSSTDSSADERTRRRRSQRAPVAEPASGLRCTEELLADSLRHKLFQMQASDVTNTPVLDNNNSPDAKNQNQAPGKYYYT